jgi:hypothetical protein
MRRLALFLVLTSCGSEGAIQEPTRELPGIRAGFIDEPPLQYEAVLPDERDPPVIEPVDKFVGSPCASDAECNYEGGVCLTDGFAGGMCSAACERFCPDAEGFPVTFCVPLDQLPAGAARIGMTGACLSRCDYSLYVGTGCREEYGCIEETRAGEPDVVRRVCMPGVSSELSGCYAELAALGVDFEITERADEHPAGRPDLTCHIEDPVIIHPPVHGVDLLYADGDRTPNVLAACRMAKALVKTIDDMKARGAVAMMHYGTYNCRPISGSDNLSRHAFADAIDVVGFILEDGSRYTVANDFEQDVADPETIAGQYLFDAVHRWHDQKFWNIILTPNYNTAHRDHFHVDLTPASDYLNFAEAYYLGPADYVD